MGTQDRVVFRFGEFSLDTARGSLGGPGEAELLLRPKSFTLLRYLLERPGVLHSRETLLDALWPGIAITDDSLTQCVGDLRRALGDSATAVLRTLPRRGYMLAVPVVREAAPVNFPASAGSSTASGIPPPEGDLLVFEALEPASDELDAQRFARTVERELLKVFSQSEMIRVQTRATIPASPESYRLSGAVRRAGPEPLLSLVLEEADTGRVMWADEVALPPPNQREDALAILFARLETLVITEALRRVRQKPLEALRAYDLALLGAALSGRGNEADTREAEQCLLRAIRMDPGIAIAHAYYATILIRRLHYVGQRERTTERRQAVDIARRALELKPRSALCLAALAYTLALLKQWDVAVENARRAVVLSTLSAVVPRFLAAAALLHCGEVTEAVAALQETITLDPFGPPALRSVLGTSLLLAGRPAEAHVELRRAAVLLPDFAPCLRSTIVAAVELGRLDEAREVLARLRRLHPNWLATVQEFLSFLRDQHVIDRYLNAFAICGETVGREKGGAEGTSAA